MVTVLNYTVCLLSDHVNIARVRQEKEIQRSAQNANETFASQDMNYLSLCRINSYRLDIKYGIFFAKFQDWSGRGINHTG